MIHAALTGVKFGVDNHRVLRKSERDLLDEVETRLVEKFPQLPASRVSAAIGEAHAHFARSPIRDFLPLLIERRVTDELTRAVTAPEPAHSG